MNLAIFETKLEKPQDIDAARRLAKRLAGLTGLSVFDQARLATAVAEIAANTVRHAGGGEVEFSILRRRRRQSIEVIVTNQQAVAAAMESVADSPSAVVELGFAVASSLVDSFAVENRPGAGSVIVLGKTVDAKRPQITDEEAAAWREELAHEAAISEAAPPPHQRELYEALAELRHKERDLKRELRKVEQLNEKLDVLSLVASNTDHSVVITDRNGLIEWVNDGFSRITGYEPFEVVGKKPGLLLQGPLTDRETVLRIGQCLRRAKALPRRS